MTSYTGRITGQVKKRAYDGQQRLLKVVSFTNIMLADIYTE